MSVFLKATSAMNMRTDFVQAAESPPPPPEEESKETELEPEPVCFSFGYCLPSISCRSKMRLDLDNKTNFIKAAESPPPAPEEEIKEPEPVRSLFNFKPPVVPVAQRLVSEQD
jgi:hypothetical protein